MKRVSVLVTISTILLMLAVAGCDDTESSTESGFALTTTNCSVFGIQVSIDGEYQDFASSEELHFFPLPPGTYDLYARSNIYIDDGDYFFCWTREVTISKGKVTGVVLDCTDARCTDD